MSCEVHIAALTVFCIVESGIYVQRHAECAQHSAERYNHCRTAGRTTAMCVVYLHWSGLHCG